MRRIKRIRFSDAALRRYGSIHQAVAARLRRCAVGDRVEVSCPQERLVDVIDSLARAGCTQIERAQGTDRGAVVLARKLVESVQHEGPLGNWPESRNA